jgi:hypothetical protein
MILLELPEIFRKVPELSKNTLAQVFGYSLDKNKSNEVFEIYYLFN